MSAPLPDRLPDLSLRHRLQDGLAATVIGIARALPYDKRLAIMGWFGRIVLGPVAMHRRIRANLAHVWPDLPADQARAIRRAVSDSLGRSIAELYSGDEFCARAAALPLNGPGVAALLAAREAGRPVILASAHFGNYDAWRANLARRGWPVGALYKPLSNPAANRRYLAAMAGVSSPLFSRDSAGMAAMVRFLRAGGMLGVLTDVHLSGGIALDFVGKPALTATSAAKLALKYDALLVPIYATRVEGPEAFRIDIEDPVPHSDAITMTTALNASISARIADHPGQWFWAHRRWKGCQRA